MALLPVAYEAQDVVDPFEQSADMRLLELRRKELGKDAPPPSTWSAANTDMHEGIPIEEVPAPALHGARLFVDLTANPKTKLVAGAVVTLALSIQNAGDEDAENVRVMVPVPGESAFRDGSLQVDGRDASGSYADALFGEGYAIGKLAAGQRAAFVWKISVQRGTSSLVVSPRVTSVNAAVAGGGTLLLSRGAPHRAAQLPAEYRPALPESERPFYELDTDEEQTFSREFPEPPLQMEPAPLVVMPDVVPDPGGEPAVAPAEPREPLPSAAQSSAPQSSAQQPESQPPALYCAFDSASLGLVKKLFAAESFGQVPHYILQNSLACSLEPDGKDASLRTHFSQQAGLLSRALLMRKLHKPMQVGEFSTGKTGFALSADSHFSPGSAPSRLYLHLTQADVEFCAPIEGRNQLETFIRIRQLAVALQARKVRLDDVSAAATIERLLGDYAAAARAAINRTFIKSKLDRNFDPFGPADAVTDTLARELIAVLEPVTGG